MATELVIDTTGKTVYADYQNASGQWWTGTVFEAFNSAHWTTYAQTCTEQGATGIYATTVPSLAAAAYVVTYRERQGVSPAVSDPLIGYSNLPWSGSARLSEVDLDVLLTSTPLTLVISNPVAADGSIVLVKGDDYLAADGRSLTWSSSLWPDLTSATITLNANKSSGNSNQGSTTFTANGSVTSNTNPRVVSVDLPNAVTSLLASGAYGYSFEVTATLSDTHKVTLVMGTVTVKTI
jgi:hypothetical protein